MTSEARRLRTSPSNFIISKWSLGYGHNVTELFKLLSLMQSFRAMEQIKHLVDPAYHIWFKPKQQTHSSEKKLKDLKELKEKLNIPEICVQQLKEATNNWAEANILGEGGFGIVYVGDYLLTKMAIKKLVPRVKGAGLSKANFMQSLNELRLLNRVRHDNILPIYGYAFEDDGTCFLVFQLMAGKALDVRLSIHSGFKPLIWFDRLKIAKGTAR
jgi:Protein tyrosine and serine/threonine kinase